MAQYNRTGPRSISQSVLPVGYTSGNSSTTSLSLTNAQQIAGQLISDFSIGPATQQVGNTISSFIGGGNFSPLSAPLNFIHNLLPNMPLSGAIQQTLSTVFPNAQLNLAISPILMLAYQDSGIYQSLEQYSGYINNLSQSILGIMGGAYPGVHISSNSNLVDIWDGSQSIGSSVIDYKDLIGQPTWLDFNTVSVKIVLRGGLRVGMDITLPATLYNFSGASSVLPSANSQNQQRSNVTLSGTYKIMKVLHVGDFRNPDGANWSTNIEAAVLSSVAGSQAQLQNQNQNASQNQGGSNVVIKFRND